MTRPQQKAGPVEVIEEAIVALLFAAMVLITVSQVVARYVFNSGAIWAVELTTYCFAWLVLYGASWGVRHSAHLGVDAFVKLFPQMWQRAFGLAGVAAALLYAAVMLAGSWEYVSKLYRVGIESEDLPIPQWVPMTILLIGMVLLIVRLLEAGIRILRGEQTLMLTDEARSAIGALGDDHADPRVRPEKR